MYVRKSKVIKILNITWTPKGKVLMKSDNMESNVIKLSNIMPKSAEKYEFFQIIWLSLLW